MGVVGGNSSGKNAVALILQPPCVKKAGLGAGQEEGQCGPAHREQRIWAPRADAVVPLYLTRAYNKLQRCEAAHDAVDVGPWAKDAI